MEQQNIILSVRERADKVLDIGVSPVSAVAKAMEIFHRHRSPEDFQFSLNETGNFGVRMRYGVTVESIVGTAAEIVYVENPIDTSALAAY